MTQFEMTQPNPSTSSQPLVAELGDQNSSVTKQYQRMFVGRTTLLALVQYELLTGLLGPMPGALGYFLRQRLYRYLFRRIGSGSVIGYNVTLRSPGNITLGSQIMVDDYAVLDAKGETSFIELGDQILVGRSTILSCNEARIRIGNYVSIGPFCVFASKSHIDVGSNVAIGSGTHLMAGSHASDLPDIAVIHQERISLGITIEDNVWIGSGARILDGVTVGRNSIVGAGAMVSQNVPAYTTVLGNPARVVQKRKTEGPA